MSWSFKHIGSRAAVAALVSENKTVPNGIKSAISEILLRDDLEGAPKNGVHDSARAEGHGHGGADNWSGVTKLEVELFTAVTLPESPTAQAAPATQEPAK